MELPLPPNDIRQGVPERRFDDDHFLATARQDAEVLTAVGLRSGATLVDFGAGPGRLALGLISLGWSGSYLGVEVKEIHVKWATAEITSRHPHFRFVTVDAPHARYNPNGSDFRKLPAADESADMICAFSVFSHMLSDDTAAYLTEFHRILAPDGRAYITVFMAEDVPDETENPPWSGNWNGPLHCVLYSISHITALIEDSGLSVERMLPPSNPDQVGLELRRA